VSDQVGRKHDLNCALDLIRRKGCQIRFLPTKTFSLAMVIVPAGPEIGIKTWGALDYLRRCHGYLISLSR